MVEPVKGGWAFPKYNAKRSHFYPSGTDVSLCKRSRFDPSFREPETGQRTDQDCPECVRLLTACTGVQIIAAEQLRHRGPAEGYTAEGDYGKAGELARAAATYAWARGHQLDVLRRLGEPGCTEEYATHYLRQHRPNMWPWDPEFWKPTDDPVRDLAKAGALIASAIDALLAEGATR